MDVSITAAIGFACFTLGLILGMFFGAAVAIVVDNSAQKIGERTTSGENPKTRKRDWVEPAKGQKVEPISTDELIDGLTPKQIDERPPTKLTMWD